MVIITKNNHGMLRKTHTAAKDPSKYRLNTAKERKKKALHIAKIRG
jgi:hypothetical protein